MFISLACLALLASGMAYGQPQSYPHKPIRWILPYAPGAATESIARIVAQRLSERRGAQIIIDSRGGGATVVGTEIAAGSSMAAMIFN